MCQYWQRLLQPPLPRGGGHLQSPAQRVGILCCLGEGGNWGRRHWRVQPSVHPPWVCGQVSDTYCLLSPLYYTTLYFSVIFCFCTPTGKTCRKTCHKTCHKTCPQTCHKTCRKSCHKTCHKNAHKSCQKTWRNPATKPVTKPVTKSVQKPVISLS